MTVRSSDLDFQSIKASLRSYLEQQTEFADYDFDASGLSRILDVLAYNTHINGLTANMAINESFLSSSQLRSSVLSHAETLGYTPKSRTASTATVSGTVTIPNGPATITIPAGTTFVGEVDDTSYSYITLEPYLADNVNDTFTVTMSIKEGSGKSKTFAVGNELDQQSYVIQDKYIDTSTLTVRIYDNFTDVDNFTVYQNINSVATVNEDSRVYMLRETSNGYYEIFFGDGNVLGQSPIPGNKIQISYLVSQGSLANGSDSFLSNGIIYDTVKYQFILTTITESAGGSEKESILSIKSNAPRAYTTQNRLVTADDYTSMILKNYSTYIRDAITWGGNDNVPPQYGKVFISLNYRDNVNEETKEIEETKIKNQLLSNLSIMSIDPVFVQPEETFLELQTTFNLDATQSSFKLPTVKSAIESVIQNYMISELSTFNSAFRRSNLLTKIDNVSSAVLNSKINVRVQQRLDMDQIIQDIEDQLTANGVTVFDDFIEQDYVLNFPVLLSEPDKDDHIITSSVFKSNGQNVIVKNELGSTRLQLLDLNNVVKINNIGSYDPAKGLVSLNALKIDKDGYVGTGIKFSATPANQSTVRPLRNYIITFDPDVSDVTGNIDTGTTKVLL